MPASAALSQRASSGAGASTSARAPHPALRYAPVGGAQRTARRAPLRVAAVDLAREKISLPQRSVESKGAVFKVTMVAANDESRSFECPDNEYILNAAEAAGLDLPATCRAGICGACVARRSEGAVDQSDVADMSFTLTGAACRAGVVALSRGWVGLGVCRWSGRPDGQVCGRVTHAPMREVVAGGGLHVAGCLRRRAACCRRAPEGCAWDGSAHARSRHPPPPPPPTPAPRARRRGGPGHDAAVHGARHERLHL